MPLFPRLRAIVHPALNSRFWCHLASLALTIPAYATIDLNGDGLNDLWLIHYDAATIPADGDDDGDGVSNTDESRNWTDPRNPDDFAVNPAHLSDKDEDGLNDFEESLLGFDPQRPASSPTFGGGDLAHAVALLTSGNPFLLGGREVTGSLPDKTGAARFLMQASLGAEMDEVEALARVGYLAWIDAQIALPVSNTWHEVHAVIAQGKPYEIHDAWWRVQLTQPDRLRQRIATALTEIYVISEQSINFVPWEMMQYYDNLGRLGFGNWRDLIEHVSIDPLMGYYLSHLKNQKADPALDRYPDENYAREIMQLFSIGLWELNPDGSHKVAPDGSEIPTYDNTTIGNFARVFTGLSYGGGADNAKPADFFDAPKDFGTPMKMWEEQHDQDTKFLLNGVKLPAFADAPGRVAMDDIHDALDNLFNHPNVGPFVGRLLIQRLVTSNPSPGYIRRVAQAFSDNGCGERGDLSAVVRTILLDPEARNAPNPVTAATSGRLRESYLRYVRLGLAFRARSAEGTFKSNDHQTFVDISQIFFNSPSVFNFFLPDYRPAGKIAEAGLYAPEFQIHTSTTAITTRNLYQRMIHTGFGSVDDGPETLRLDITAEVEMADDIEALIRHLNLKMAAGALSPRTCEILRNAVAEFPADYDAAAKVKALMKMIVVSPDFAVIE